MEFRLSRLSSSALCAFSHSAESGYFRACVVVFGGGVLGVMRSGVGGVVCLRFRFFVKWVVGGDEVVVVLAALKVVQHGSRCG